MVFLTQQNPLKQFLEVFIILKLNYINKKVIN